MAQIKWIASSGGDFQTAADWSTGTVPGSADDAIFGAFGTGYLVTSEANETVNSVQLAQGVTLQINGATFIATTGTGSGVNQGVLAVDNNTTFEAGGTLAGSGTISLNSTNNATVFELTAATVTLTGGGKVTLSDNGNNYILGAAVGDTLVNVNDVISGSGQFGDGTLSLSNGVAGIINATGATQQLILNFGTAGTVTNAGLIEATGLAGLRITGGSTIVQSGTGTLKAVGAGVSVSLDNAVIQGGSLATSGGGVIQTVSTGTLNGTTINAASLVNVLNNTVLLADNTITNKGTIALTSTNNATELVANTATVTLTGGGVVTMSDNSNNYIFGAATSAPFNTFINVNNTISGSGNIGDGQMALVNQVGGTIDATGTAASLTIQTNSFSNAGLLEATNTAGLGINASTITNTGTIGAFGTASLVALYGGATILGGTLATAAGDVIEVTNTATLDGSGTHPVTIATKSNFVVVNNTALTVLGSIVNDGTLALASANNGTDLILNSATVTLSGGGLVRLSDNSQNYIYGLATAAPFDTLVNSNNTIAGSGNIGDGQLIVQNGTAGVIDATGTAASLTIQTNGFTNAGLLEDTNTAGLGINGSVITNTGTGSVGAFGAGSFINLYSGATVAGGKLATSGGGVIDVTNGTLDGSGTGGITLTTGSQLAVLNDDAVTVLGSIVNDGTIAIDSANNNTDLIINSATVTLSGGGHIVMTDNSNNEIYSALAGGVLVNTNNIISGSGNIGGGSLTLQNKVAGVINATGTSAGLVIQTIGFSNAGLLEATNTGGLDINGSVIANTGTILATGTGDQVVLYNGASIQGGLLSTANGGAIVVSNSATLDGSAAAVTLTTASQLAVLNDQTLYLQGSIVNDGTISLDSGNNSTDLIANTATVTLSGGGTVLMSDNGGNRIYGATATDTLVNVNNIIKGSGQIGVGQGSFINQAAGIIDATGTAAGISIITGAGSFTNAGLIEDTNTGGLNISNTTIANTGTIAAIGAGSAVNLGSGADIKGGTLLTKTGGVITLNSATLDGSASAVTIAAGSNLAVSNDDAMTVLGSIVNHGVIALDSSNNTTDLIVGSATLTLSGGGAITMTDNSQNRIYGTSASDVLINVDNTISGSGQIGAAQGSFVNQAAGVIDATGTGAGMTIDTGSGSFSNAGLIEDTGPGGMVITNTIITNTGTIQAVGTGAVVALNSGASISGGLLATSAGGLITLNAGTLDGTAHTLSIAAGSQLALSNDNAMFLQGAIANAGTIGIDSTNNTTDMIINSATVTLTGGGAIVMTDNSQNRIYGAATANRLVNVNNRILGAGQLGAGQLTLDNQAAGIIDATGGNALIVSLGSTFTNEGLAEGTGSGGLSIQNETLTNTGTIAAMVDSSVSITSTTSVTNYATGTLTGGTWEAISSTGTGHTSTLTIASGTIAVDAAHLVLSGIGSSIIAGGAAIETTLTTITSAGELDILGGRSATVTPKLSDSGTILLTGTLATRALTIGNHGHLNTTSGIGLLTSKGAIANSGTISASGGGSLSVTKGTLTNTGSIIALAGSTLTIGPSAVVTNIASGTLTGGTWVANGAGATLVINSAPVTTDAAVVTLSGTGSVIGSGTNGRSLETTLTGVAAGGQLNLLAGRGFASTSGALADNGLITMAGGKFTATGLSIGSTGTFIGTGTLASVATDNGLLSAGGTPAGTLLLTKAITGTGALAAGAGDTLATTGYAVGSVTVAATGTLTGAGSATGAIADSGLISFASGTLSGGSVTIASTGTLFGAGLVTVTGGIANSGTIEAHGGTLTLTNGETGGALVVDAGASLTSLVAIAAHGLTIAATGTFTGLGSVTAGTTDNGALIAAGGTLALASVSGSGTATVNTGATLSDGTALTLAGGVTFAGGSNEVLQLGTASGNTAVITGFAAGTVIDLANAAVTSVSYAAATGILSLKNGTTSVGKLNFAGTYTNHNFTVQSDGHGGTDVVFVATPGADTDAQGAMNDLRAAAAAVSAVAPAGVQAIGQHAMAGGFGSEMSHAIGAEFANLLAHDLGFVMPHLPA